MNKALALATTVVATVATHAHATVLYSNFGDGDTYSLDTGATISAGGPLGGQVNEAAVAFTVTGGDYYFNAADVAVLHSWGPDLVNLHLHADDGGIPGQVLESTTASGVTPPFEWAPPLTGTFSGTTVLQEGQQYWLSMSPEDTDVLLSWANNVVGDFGLRAWQADGGGWNPFVGDPNFDEQRSTFRIHGTLVPAPGALALLALGGMVRGRRRD